MFTCLYCMKQPNCQNKKHDIFGGNQSKIADLLQAVQLLEVFMVWKQNKVDSARDFYLL